MEIRLKDQVKMVERHDSCISSQMSQLKLDITVLSDPRACLLTGKSITMLCNFQDLQAESSAVLFEADLRKRFHLAYTRAVEAVSAVR